MKTFVKFLLFFMHTFGTFAQNIGIGTATPSTLLHLLSPTQNSVITTETGSNGFLSGLTLKSPGALYNELNIFKWAPGSSGTKAAVPLDNLSLLTTGADGGSLMIGTTNAKLLYFINNNILSGQVTSQGNWLFGSNTQYGKVNIGVNSNTMAGLDVFNNSDIGNSIAIQAYSRSPAGAAVWGISDFGNSGTAPPDYVGHGIVGAIGSVGNAVGAYALGGTALRARSASGYAINSTGLLKFAGIGEAEGKFLATDAEGNAYWNFLPPGLWTFNSTIGQIENNLEKVAITTNSGQTALEVTNNNNFGAGGIFTINSPGSINTSLTSTTNGAGLAGHIYNTGIGIGLRVGAANNVAGEFKNSSSTSPTILVENLTSATDGASVLELKNGYVKVSGSARSMIQITSTPTNTIANYIEFSYPGMASTDMLSVNHVYSNTRIEGGIGLWWNNNRWNIYRENNTAMPLNERFNVLIVKQ